MAERIKTRARANFKLVSVKQGYRPDFTVEVEWNGDSFEDDEDGLYRMGLMLDELEKRVFMRVNEMNVREGYPLIPIESAVRQQEDTNGGTRITERTVEPEAGYVDPDTGEIFP